MILWWRVGLTAILLAGAPSFGLECIGDCQLSFHVSASNVRTMLDIALGVAGPGACVGSDFGGDGQVTVDEIVAAVANAAQGCPQPVFAGTWEEDQIGIQSSTCPAAVNSAVQDTLRSQDGCQTRFRAVDYDLVSGVDCQGIEVVGALDAQGMLTFEGAPMTESMSGCTVTVAPLLHLLLNDSPTFGQYRIDVSGRGTCTLSCALQLKSRWTKQPSM